MAEIVSDDFNAATLGDSWTLEGPAGSAGLAVSGDEAYLELTIPEGDYNVWGDNRAARVMQDAPDEDFEIEARFLSEPSQGYQMQGLLIEQDADTWLRFDVYHDGSNLHIFGASTVNGNSQARFNQIIATGDAAYLRVTRAGDTWTFAYSSDGETWTTAGSYTQALSVSSVGVFAGSTGYPGDGPAFTAQVDYVNNTASPIVAEDGGSANTAPAPGDDALSTAADTALVISAADLLANDTDADGNALSLSGFAQPANGTLSDNGDGTLTYTPNAGFSGTDSFTYTVSDGTDTAQATVSVTVSASDPVNTPPVAQDDAAATEADTPVVLSVADLLSNDSDADGDALSLSGFAQPANGTLVDNGDGTLTYTPNAGFSGADSFTYTVSDGTDTAQATVAVTVSAPDPVNTPPVAGNDAASTVEGAALVLSIADLLSNDSDADGDTLFLTGFTQPANGTLFGNGDGTLTFTPNPGFSGLDSFTYTVSDGDSTATARVDLTVTSVNGAPVAADDVVSTGVGTSVVIDVLANDSDPDGDALTITSVSQPSHGSVSVDNNGTPSDPTDDRIVYTPDTGAGGGTTQVLAASFDGGTNGFTYQDDLFRGTSRGDYASGEYEGNGGQSGGGLAVDVGGINGQDITDGMSGGWTTSFTLAQDGPATLTFSYRIDMSRRYESDEYVEVLASIDGALIGTDGNDYINRLYGRGPTTDTGWVAVTLDLGTLAAGTHTLALGGHNNKKTTTSESATFRFDDVSIEAAASGSNFSGTDSFTYTVSDGTNTETATVTVVVGDDQANTAPVAADDAATTATGTSLVLSIADLLANDSDADGDTLSLTGFTQPAGGTLTDNGNGTLTYTPNAGFVGSDSFTYTVSDGTDTATATVSLNVVPDSGIRSDDFDGGALDTMWSLEGPAGTATVAASGGDAFLALAVPQGDFNAWHDNRAARLMQDAPDGDFQIEAKFLSEPTQAYQNQGLLIEQDADNWLRFDVYHDGNSLHIFGARTVNGTSQPMFNQTITTGDADYLRLTRSGDGWTFEYSADGLTWTTAGSYTQSLAVSSVGVLAGSTANPGAGPAYTAQVDYFFNTAAPIVPEDGQTSPPVAQDDTAATAAGTALVLDIAADLMANDSDADGDTLAFVGVTQPANGTLTDNGNGTLTYTPNAGFEGTDSFTYTISDGTSTDTATVTLSVGSSGAGIIDVWYGTQQEFAVHGEAQQWANILGNVDVSQVVSLAYSLNGGADRTLSIGPDTRRLEDPGDFNIDLAFNDLDGSAADDIVTIKATLASGEVVTQDVVIDYESGHEWAQTFTIDWASVTDIQDVVQVVDGLWSVSADGVRTAAPGYDRAIAIGDQTWDNYEVNLTLTIHDMAAGTPRDGAGLGFGMLWNGHTDDPLSGWQPLSGYNPIVSPFYNRGDFTLHDYAGWGSPHLDQASFTFQEDTSYSFKIRVEQTGVFDRIYKMKVWETGTAEPAGWLLQGTEDMSDPVTGSFVIFAHHWDLTVGDIAVTEIEGNDIVPGADGADTIIAVDTGQARPGEGEIDVLSGGAGADVFVFGDAGGEFYDDGNAGSSGTGDYGLIWDFEAGIDRIQIAGSFNDYRITDASGGLPDGAAIYRDNDGGPDELIGIVNGVSASALGSDDFIEILIA